MEVVFFFFCFFFFVFVFCLMIRRPPRSTQSRSSAASDVYKRQAAAGHVVQPEIIEMVLTGQKPGEALCALHKHGKPFGVAGADVEALPGAVSYTHLRAHETRHDLVCRLLLEKKKTTRQEEI